MTSPVIGQLSGIVLPVFSSYPESPHIGRAFQFLGHLLSVLPCNSCCMIYGNMYQLYYNNTPKLGVKRLKTGTETAYLTIIQSTLPTCFWGVLQINTDTLRQKYAELTNASATTVQKNKPGLREKGHWACWCSNLLSIQDSNKRS